MLSRRGCLLLARSIVSLDTSIPVNFLCWQQLGPSVHPGSPRLFSFASSSADKADVLSTATPASSASILNKYVSQELVTDVSSTINRLTGYEGIDRLKARVATVDEALTDCKKQLQAAKLAYDQQLSRQGQLHRCGQTLCAALRGGAWRDRACANQGAAEAPQCSPYSLLQCLVPTLQKHAHRQQTEIVSSCLHLATLGSIAPLCVI